MHSNRERKKMLEIVEMTETLRSAVSNILEITFVRHGETEWNKIGKFNSKTDLELDEHGRDECLARSSSFREITANDTLLFSSPKIRCQQTAKILFPNSDFLIDEQLHEMDFGGFEGRNPAEIYESPDKDDFEIWRSEDNDTPVLGVETVASVLERANIFFGSPNLSGKMIAIVTHGVFARIVILAIIGFNPYHYRSIRLDNCRFAHIQIETGKPRLIGLNCNSTDGKI